ncbi:Nn.00g102040.m01.CDS01 [Neocucurbitaria sp. VM-36]
MPTKTALTIVTSSTPRPTSTSSSTSFATITSIATSTLQTQVRPTQSVFVDSISFTPSSTASASATAAPAAIATESPPRMTPAQIAGLSVAAVAAFVMAIGLMALSVCLRRRKERKFVEDSSEKGQYLQQKQQSARFSHYVSVEAFPEPPRQFPMPPLPVARTGGKYPELDASQSKGQPTGLKPVRPVQRLGVGTSNNSSDSILPLDQIGLAISAELDGRPAAPKKVDNTGAGQQRPVTDQSNRNVPFRPISTLTQCTVFEEDDVPARRRSSMLLPTPPVPIPPIRNLQPSRPSRPPPTFVPDRRQTLRRSELFLDIPVRHDRPQPKRIIAAEIPSSRSPKHRPLAPKNRLAPPIQLTSTASYDSTATTASSREPGNTGDILDYYLTTHQAQAPAPAPRSSPAHSIRPKESPKAAQVKSKKSQSTVSRTASRASTNIRDSLSSQTSFETTDASDPTPDDEDEDKQLSDNNKQQLSPVAESPISNLRYPKVPRASNQLVPRSPRSPQNHKSPNRPQKSPRRPPESSALLQKRAHDLPPLLLETRPRLNSPQRDPFTSPPRKANPRSHVRSNSTESWAATPASKIDRKSKVQSGIWTTSPMMYEPAVVRPLKVRRRRDEMMEVNVGRDVDVDADGLKSPVWVPRLTPTRKGEDLFISVGWGESAR